VAPVLRLGRLEIRPRDLRFLGDGEFLNDTVIDFILRLAMDVVAPAGFQDKFYVASTHFFQQLTSRSAQSGDAGWENVRKWTRGLAGGLLSRECIVVPVNEAEVHWWVAIVCRPHGVHLQGNQRIVCLDSSPIPFSKRPAVRFLLGYLRREWRERGGGEPITPKMRALVARAPRQRNYYDCGVFVVEYLMYLFMHPEVLSGIGSGTQTCKGWFSQKRVSHRRKRLRMAISQLANEAQKRGELDVEKLLQDEGVRRMVYDALTDAPQTSAKEIEEAKRAKALRRRLRLRMLGGQSRKKTKTALDSLPHMGSEDAEEDMSTATGAEAAGAQAEDVGAAGVPEAAPDWGSSQDQEEQGHDVAGSEDARDADAEGQLGADPAGSPGGAAGALGLRTRGARMLGARTRGARRRRRPPRGKG